MTCNVCREEGHVATKCSKKGTCFNCRQPGHVSHDCPDRSYGRSSWASRPKVSPWFPSQMGPLVVGPLVVGPLPLRLIVPSPFLWWGLAHWARPFLLLPPLHLVGVVLRTVGLPVSVPDSELSLSVCGDSSAASTVLNSQSYIVSNKDNALRNANDIDNASSKVSNSSNVSCGNASSNVSDSAICTASSSSNAVNVNNLDNVASNAKTGAGNAMTCSSVDSEPKSCSSADLKSNGSPVLGGPVPDASMEVSPSSSVDTKMVSTSNHRKPPGFASGSTSSEPGKSKVSKKAPGPPGCHSLPASVSLATRTASSRGPLS